MAVLPIYLYGTDVLRAIAKSVNELDNATIKLIVNMFETMNKANGIGLAATQVGELSRVIVVDITDVEEDKDRGAADPPESQNSAPKRLVLINPEIVEEEGSWTMEEGCLSFPEVRADVVRSEKIKVRFRDGDYRQQELIAEGLLARVILHETDHLDGILFIDHLSTARRGLLKTKLRAIKKGDVETAYPVVTYAEV